MYAALKDTAERYIGITYSMIVSRMDIFVASSPGICQKRKSKMDKSEVRHWGMTASWWGKGNKKKLPLQCY